MSASREVPSFESVVISEADLKDGYAAKAIFEGKSDTLGITFDDLIVLPGAIGT